jgi:uncharacterized protein (DUF427 family)
LAVWSYREAYPEVGRISDLVSFEPGQTVIPHGPDRDLDVSETLPRGTQ